MSIMVAKSEMIIETHDSKLRACNMNPKSWASMPAIFTLSSQPVDEVMIYPRIYLACAQEIFATTLYITWALTFFFFPSQIFDHPARPIIGSFNPCFGWDYPPASYIALVMCSFNVFLTWRYMWLSRARTVMENPDKVMSFCSCQRYTWYFSFKLWADLALAFSSSLWLCLWLLGPKSNGTVQSVDLTPATKEDIPQWTGHTLIFAFMALAWYCSVLAVWLEDVFDKDPNNNPTFTWTAYVIVYGLANLYLTLVYFTDLAMYTGEISELSGATNYLPWYFTQFADIVWLICLGSINSMMPYTHAIKITKTLVYEDREALNQA